ASAGWWWPERSVGWRYNPTGAPPGLSGHASAVAAGAETWSSAGADFTFTGGGQSSAGTGACHSTLDGENTVGWAPQPGSVLAVTCTWYEMGGSPRPAIEFDMEIDPEWEWTTGSPVRVDLESVAVHEFGHALGLAHSQDSSAVMYASYSEGSVKRELTEDDLAGLYALYGTTGEPTPTNTPTPTPTPTATPPPPLPLVPGANLATWPGPTTSTSALEPYEDLIAIVYGWDSATQSWQRWSPSLPPWANSLAQLEHGEAYWFIAKDEGTIIAAP
ncbi:MAG TPA: matrixin family metalloprotease, partial [Chloroflexota bacterium]